jgi:hypothetical protein
MYFKLSLKLNISHFLISLTLYLYIGIRNEILNGFFRSNILLFLYNLGVQIE